MKRLCPILLLLALALSAGVAAQQTRTDDKRGTPTQPGMAEEGEEAREEAAEARDEKRDEAADMDEDETRETMETRETSVHDAPTPSKAEAQEAGENIRKHLGEALTAFEANDRKGAADHLTQAVVLLRTMAGHTDKVLHEKEEGKAAMNERVTPATPPADRAEATPDATAEDQPLGIETDVDRARDQVRESLDRGREEIRKDVNRETEEFRQNVERTRQQLERDTEEAAEMRDRVMEAERDEEVEDAETPEESRERIEGELTQQQRDLRESIRKIEELAVRLETEEDVEAGEVRDTVADLYQTLTEYHYDIAQRLLHPTAEAPGAEISREETARDMPETTAAGVEGTTPTLSTEIRDAVSTNVADAAAHFRAWAALTEEDLDEETEQAVATLENWAGKLEEGAEWSVAEAREALDSFGERIGGLGYSIRDDYDRDESIRTAGQPGTVDDLNRPGETMPPQQPRTVEGREGAEAPAETGN